MSLSASSIRPFAAAAALLASTLAFAAAQTTPHLESCTNWSEADGHFGATNSCAKPVALQFMRLTDQRAARRLLEPGERFDADAGALAVSQGGWLFTTCPEGFAPSVAFTPANQATIIASRYECVRK